jgi:hypothetical protein
MEIAYCGKLQFKLVDLLQYFSLWCLGVWCVVLVVKSDSKEHAASIFRAKMCRVWMLQVVKEDLWEVKSDGTWSWLVVVMLRNCHYTKLAIRVCIACHSGRYGRENMRGVALFVVITYGWFFSSGSQPWFRVEVRWESGVVLLSPGG